MTFRVGQKVVHIGFPRGTWRRRLDEWLHPIPGPWPVRDEVYTITKIVTDDYGAYYVSLAELIETIDDYWGEGWDLRGFRPVVERKTDISIFTKLLTPNKRERVNACGNED